MSNAKIRLLALDLDGTLTDSKKKITPRTRAALDAAMARGVQIVLASGRPAAGVLPLARELGLQQKGGYLLPFNGGIVIDCRTGEVLHREEFPHSLISEVCRFAAEEKIVALTYRPDDSIVTETPDDRWVIQEGQVNGIPVYAVPDLAAYVDFPICKMLLTLDPSRLDDVWEKGLRRFAGRIDLYPSCGFFLEAVPLGVAKDVGLGHLLNRLGLTRENLMVCGDGINDRSMIELAGVGVAMRNADNAVRQAADYVTQNDNDHDGVAEAVERFILNCE